MNDSPETESMQRVAAYIDGFNLYYGLRSKGWKRYYWLDMPKLVQLLLRPGQELVLCHYFTAHIASSNHGHQDQQRQKIWLEAVEHHGGVQMHFGKYLVKQRQCRQCGHAITQPEEKMTDVRIATQMLMDAFNNAFDVALLISGDSDLKPPLESIRKQFSTKKLLVAFPPGRISNDLKQVAHAHFVIGRNKFRDAQMPDEITKPDGYVLQRPSSWR